MASEQSQDFTACFLPPDLKSSLSLCSQAPQFELPTADKKNYQTLFPSPSNILSPISMMENLTSPDLTDSLQDNEELMELENARRRGNYHIFNPEEKNQILEYASQHGLEKAAKRFSSQNRKLTVRKLRNWMESQGKQKGTQGRKSNDPERDNKILDWFHAFRLANRRPPTRRETTDKAKKIGGEDFKASKGWLDKFARKFGLDFSPGKHKPASKSAVIIDSIQNSIDVFQRMEEQICYSTSASSKDESESAKADLEAEIEFTANMLNPQNGFFF